MKRYLIAIFVLLATLAGSVVFLHNRTHTLALEIEALHDLIAQSRLANDEQRMQIVALQSAVAEMKAFEENYEDSRCDEQFANGIFVLPTSTPYGPSSQDAYEIYHVSVPVSEWTLNAGMRLNSFGLPTDFYLDYDGDGRIDTALAARVVREIPIVGNTIADRLLADSSVHQRLYSVFRCEWRNAEYTSAGDVNESMSGAAYRLWSLVEENSAEIAKWIQSQ